MRISPELLLLARRLIISHAQSLLPGEACGSSEICSFDELSRLMSLASCLAFSPEVEQRTLAYELAIRAVSITIEGKDTLAQAAGVILSRLGNFPGLTLLRSQNLSFEGEVKLPLVFALEEEARRASNTIPGIRRSLTDFQSKLFYTLQESRSASISAPTSAGKSFVFAVDIAQKLKLATMPVSIAYIVPTRALIRQVTGDIRKHIKEAGVEGVPVRCVPLPVPSGQLSKGVVYVLTQERLLTLLAAERSEEFNLDMLLIDEAHGIADGARGIQLHMAVSQVVRRFPNVNVFFASPCVSNPEHLLDLFGLNQRSNTFIEEQSPVGQNLVLVHLAKSASARFELMVNDEAVALGDNDLGYNCSKWTSAARRAAFACSIAERKRLGKFCCIVYASSPADAESVAKDLAKLQSYGRELPTVIKDFIEFLAEHIHPEYDLIELIKKRVAFHHGTMPGPVRAGVEDLFASGHLRFICCTATLLQGVNLPASDIIIENPEQGGELMNRASFLNLIGRAGRLGKEFHGNVWCLRPDVWKEPLYKGDKLQKLRSALEDIVADGGSGIQGVLNGSITKSDLFDTGAAALGKVLSDFVLSSDPKAGTRYSEEAEPKNWQETLRQLRPLADLLPPDLLRRNFTIHPGKLSDLFEFLSGVDDIDPYIPIETWQKGSYQRLKCVMQTARERLNPQSRPYKWSHAWLAFWWIAGKNLRWLIDSRFSQFKKGADRDGKPLNSSVNDVIRKVISNIERTLRYEYARDLKAYIDVLTLVLSNRSGGEFTRALPSLPLYLECGSNQPGVIAIMSLGISRMTALMIHKKIRMRKDASPEDWHAAIACQNFDKFPVPKTCIQEIKHLILPM